MIRYAVRATPWTLLIAGCALIAGLMTLVARWPSVMWPLEGTSVGVIAAINAWAMDERCASIVDTLPRPLWWRTTGRVSVAVPATLGVWVTSLALSGSRIPAHFWLFALQGLAAASLALAASVWPRSNGSAEPGAAFATIVIPTATALALIRPLERRMPLFPVWISENWARSTAIWLTLLVISAAVFTWILLLDCQPRCPQP